MILLLFIFNFLLLLGKCALICSCSCNGSIAFGKCQQGSLISNQCEWQPNPSEYGLEKCVNTSLSNSSLLLSCNSKRNYFSAFWFCGHLETKICQPSRCEMGATSANLGTCIIGPYKNLTVLNCYEPRTAEDDRFTFEMIWIPFVLLFVAGLCGSCIYLCKKKSQANNAERKKLKDDFAKIYNVQLNEEWRKNYRMKN